MPPKKSKPKSKAVKETFVQRKVYEFLRAEHITAKEQKRENHLKNLKDSRNYVKESWSEVAQLQDNQLIDKKWQEYVNCSPYPKPYIPPDIRLLIEKLKYFEKISTDHDTMSWRLQINDRSILTQDFSQEDLTHSTLKREKRTSFGSVYERDVNFCLEMLRRIDDFLQNATEVDQCDVVKLNDIKKLRTSLQQEIINFINRFTYHILSSEETHVNSVDALTCDYSFQSNHFQMHIWALQNVPIRFQYLESPRFKANLHAIDAMLSIPTSIMKENFVIRALHMNFDHFSDNDQVFYNKTEVTPSAEIYAVTDLTECLSNEWLMQMEIMNRVRNELIQTRQKYEDNVQLFKVAEAKKKKKRKEEELTKMAHRNALRLMNLTAEPVVVEEDMFPDIREDFLEEEQRQYENYLYNMYSPANLNLKAHEINLKKYFILGGIYQFYQIQKPQHTDFNNINMTWHLNNSQLVVVEELEIPLDSLPLPRRSTFYQREPRRTLTATITETSNEPDPECPWFILTIQLPEQLCHWGQPVVCQYEKLTKRKTIPQLLETDKEPSILENSRMSNNYLPFLRPQNEGLTDSILNLQHPSKDSFFRTSISKIHVSEEHAPLQEDVYGLKDVLNIADFYLNSNLSKDQVTQIQRYVLPRMISSFKFHKEIQEYDSRAIRRRGKSKARRIRRKRFDEQIDQTADSKYQFAFGPVQNNPERLIPIYPRDEPLRLLQLQTNEMEMNLIKEGVKTFAQLVKLINFIKWWHKVQVRKIIDLKPFESSYPIVNKRFQEKTKQNLKPFLSAASMASSTRSRSHFKIADNKSLNKKSTTSKTTVAEPSTDKLDTMSMGDFASFKDSVSKTFSFNSDLVEGDNENEGDIENTLQTYSCSRWTTRHILKSEFNRDKHTVVVQTNRLGIFAVAFPKYEHFPFKLWKMEPSEIHPNDEIVFTLETQHVTCILYINKNGIKCRATETTKKFTRKTKIYLTIDEPITNLKELKKILRENNLNIFADVDAKFYIENGYFSEKHLSTELHTYDCMATNCTQMTFKACEWNRLAERRDIILTFLQYQYPEENSVDVRITPEEAFFVDIDEMCSDDLDKIYLNFTLTWRNIGMSSDLNQLINSVYPTVRELKCKNARLLNLVRNLLYEIRPLSYS